MSRLKRAARGVIPSIAKLTYSPWVKYCLQAVSQIPDLFFSELRTLPPVHLRVRVGVDDKLFFNQLLHIKRGESLWVGNLLEGFCTQDSTVVELGCGCGRMARPLFENPTFRGQFVGIDIDDEMLDWCRRHMQRPNFSWLKSEHRSSVYSQGNNVVKSSFWTIPLEDNSVDFVYSTSLFTHLLEPQVDNYLREAHRILKPKQRLRMTFFSLDSVRRGDRWTFKHPIGRAYVENPRLPEAAVAYPDKVMMDMAASASFAECVILNSPVQSHLICRK